MATALGTYNPNSKHSQSLRAENSPLAQVPPLPLSRDAEIRIAEQRVWAIENLRAFRFGIGDLYGARLQAIRLGRLRAELRRMKRGM